MENKTLIVYDNEGFILSQMQGSSLREPVGVPFIWVEVPQGKYLVSIDTTGEEHLPIFEDLPKSETDILKERLQATEDAILALMDMSMI